MKRLFDFLRVLADDPLTALGYAALTLLAAGLGLGLRFLGLLPLPAALGLAALLIAAGTAFTLRGDADLEDALLDIVAPTEAADTKKAGAKG